MDGIISQEGTDCPALKYLNKYVKAGITAAWHDIGVELLDIEDESMLNAIKSNFPGDVNKCTAEMLQLWLARKPEASWNHLIEVLREPNIKLNALAAKIEAMLSKDPNTTQHGVPSGEQNDETANAYHQATKRIDTLEKGRQDDVQRIGMLERDCQEYAKRIETLEKRNDELEITTARQTLQNEGEENGEDTMEKRIEELQKQQSNLIKLNETLTKEVSSMAVVPKGSSFNETDFQQVEQCMQRINYLEKRWGNLSNEIQDISKSNSQLSAEIDNLKRHQSTVSIPSSKVAGFGNEMVPYYDRPSADVKQLEEKVLEVERTLNVISVHHSELELQLQASLASTHNGAFLWRIPEVRQRIRDAKIGRITSIYSPPFYTGRNGYKMCIRAYLNGDGSGEGTHLSIFFILMKGEYDPLLQWPFEPSVCLILVDQDHKKHLVQTFKPNTQSSSFQKPKTDMNVASGCPEFADLSILDNTSYVKDDVMYIKAIVDTSKIFHP